MAAETPTPSSARPRCTRSRPGSTSSSSTSATGRPGRRGKTWTPTSSALLRPEAGRGLGLRLVGQPQGRRGPDGDHPRRASRATVQVDLQFIKPFKSRTPRTFVLTPHGDGTPGRLDDDRAEDARDQDDGDLQQHGQDDRPRLREGPRPAEGGQPRRPIPELRATTGRWRRPRFLKGHGTENDFVLLPDPDGSVHGDLDPDLVARAVRPPGRSRRATGCSGWSAPTRTTTRPPSPRAARPSGSWTTATPTGRPRRCAATASGCSRATSSSTRASTRRGRCRSATRAGVLKVAHVRTATAGQRGHGRARGARRDQGRRRRRWPGPRCTCRWATRTPWPSSSRLADAGPLLEPPGHDEAVYPARGQRRVRRPPRCRGTWRCGCTSAARGRPARAAPGPARRWSRPPSPTAAERGARYDVPRGRTRRALARRLDRQGRVC